MFFKSIFKNFKIMLIVFKNNVQFTKKYKLLLFLQTHFS